MKDDELIATLAATLPLLEELETGQDCAEYAYAKGSGFQAMTYCPEAFEALRSIPAAKARIEALTAEVARKDAALRFYADSEVDDGGATARAALQPQEKVG